MPTELKVLRGNPGHRPMNVDEPHLPSVEDEVFNTPPIELTGDAPKLDAFLEAMERSAILETVRTGSSGIGRGERILRV